MKIKCKTERCDRLFVKKGHYHLYCHVCRKLRHKARVAEYRSSAWYKRRFVRLRNDPTKYEEYKRMMRGYQNAWNFRVKVRVLTYYGKNGRLRCCWKNCLVSDIDCLTLDHVLDNGATHRRSGYVGGVQGYRQLIVAKFPKGFQTLCANHQLKKENKRRRKDKI